MMRIGYNIMVNLVAARSPYKLNKGCLYRCRHWQASSLWANVHAMTDISTILCWLLSTLPANNCVCNILLVQQERIYYNISDHIMPLSLSLKISRSLIIISAQTLFPWSGKSNFWYIPVGIWYLIIYLYVSSLYEHLIVSRISIFNSGLKF